MIENRYHFEGQENVYSPQLVFYPQIIEENISLMIKMAGGTRRLWPHIKTHKMEKVTKMLMDAGISRFKCATIAELEMVVKTGAKAALMAYPLVSPNMERFISICKDFPSTCIYAIGDDTEQVRKLGILAKSCGITIKLLMDIDMGQHRTGVDPKRIKELYPMWSMLGGIHLCGFHCYDGHRHEYELKELEEAIRPMDEVIDRVKHDLLRQGLDCSIIVMGGTPTFPCHEYLTDAYLSPGTCVIQDSGYRRAYPYLPFVPGAALLTRVISRPMGNTFTLDLGTKAVACDPPIPRAEIVGMEYAQTLMHNEEHWVLKVPDEHLKDIPEIGSVLIALPVHICPTTVLYPSVLAVVDGKINDRWEVTAGKRRIFY